LIAPEHGGHLGFLSRGESRFWVDGAALNWMEGVLEPNQLRIVKRERSFPLAVKRESKR